MFVVSKLFWVISSPINIFVFILTLGTILMFTRFRRTGRNLVVLATGAALVYGTVDMPRVGDPNAPATVSPVTEHYIEYSDDENRFVEADRYNGLIRAAHIKKSDAAHAKLVNTGEARRMKYEALRKKIVESGIYQDLNKDEAAPKFKASFLRWSFRVETISL